MQVMTFGTSYYPSSAQYVNHNVDEILDSIDTEEEDIRLRALSTTFINSDKQAEKVLEWCWKVLLLTLVL